MDRINENFLNILRAALQGKTLQEPVDLTQKEWARPYLLPAAWLTRIRKYRKETKSGRDSKSSDTLKIGSQRVALLKEYGIIE